MAKEIYQQNDQLPTPVVNYNKSLSPETVDVDYNKSLSPNTFTYHSIESMAIPYEVIITTIIQNTLLIICSTATKK